MVVTLDPQKDRANCVSAERCVVFESKSIKGLKYHTHLKRGSWRCECPGFSNHERCWHVTTVYMNRNEDNVPGEL